MFQSDTGSFYLKCWTVIRQKQDSWLHGHFLHSYDVLLTKQLMDERKLRLFINSPSRTNRTSFNEHRKSRKSNMFFFTLGKSTRIDT